MLCRSCGAPEHAGDPERTAPNPCLEYRPSWRRGERYSCDPGVKEPFPQAEIGFLTSSWARPIIENNPEIKYVHTFDHFLLNRSGLSKWSKFNQHMLSLRRALREMRKLRYEIAIDTYHFIQNSIPLLWLARIPVRIGYISGGFGPLLTHPIPWISQDKASR